MFYVALYKDVTLEGLIDILDGNAVVDSWADAAYFNMQEERENAPSPPPRTPPRRNPIRKGRRR